MKTTTHRIRGRRLAPCERLGNLLLDQAAVLDDDRLNDAHTLEDYRTFLSDGYMDPEEADHLYQHLRLDAELTDIAAGLNRCANQTSENVVALLDAARQRKSESRPQATLNPTSAA